MEDAKISPFFKLPLELIQNILKYLPLSDLLSVGLVNRFLHEQTLEDLLYKPLVQENVPGMTVNKPRGSSWRELYITHHPYWFIPRQKIWFADSSHTGKLVISRYNPRIDAIEAYALVAERPQPHLMPWSWNPTIIIHSFNPRVRLDLNIPVVRLDAAAYANATGQRRRLHKEVSMSFPDTASGWAAEGLYSQLMLAKPWPKEIITPASPVWPPLTLPSETRSLNSSPSQFRDSNHRPSILSELSTTTFRTRKGIQFSARSLGLRMHVGEEITTWATLPEECYTPTPQKPWQGIWCGDYGGHGCEFLLITQPDNPKPLPERAQMAMLLREDEVSGSEAEEALSGADDAEPAPTEPEEPASHEDPFDESIYRGRIEAIKLTGDPNVPRGEITFIAPDIGPGGFIRNANDNLFKGARVVKGVGHIAAHNFRNDDFIASQLILVSHDRLAQYWEAFGHVSFYERVNIDEFTKVA